MVQQQAGCSVSLCTNSFSWPGSQGYSCPSITTCYRLRTSTNQTVCVPQGACRLFDTCINGTRCASNLTICVVDSCCPVPMCMPLVMVNLCDQPTAMSTSPTTRPRICPNATWSSNYITLLNSSNSMYNNFIIDYFVDANGSIYIANSSANYIIKYTPRGLSVASFIGSGGFSPYTFQRMTVDANGTVYTCEYRTDSSIYGSTTYYRIQRYDSNSSIYGTTVFGETACGTGPNRFCGCADMFIDRRNSIYCSDSLYHIVINITPINPQVTVIAGTTNASGSQLNQLNSPQGISVDTNGTLFVADSGNNRVLMFLAGNRYGVHLFTTSSIGMYYYATYGLTVDSAGSVYVAGSTLQRWAPGTTYLTTIFNSSEWGWSYYYYYYPNQRIAFDNYGNIIVRLSSSSGLGLYNIITNSC